MITIFKQSDENAPSPKISRILDASARLVPLMNPTAEFQGAKLSFDYRVVGDKLQIVNVLLEVGPPTKLIVQ